LLIPKFGINGAAIASSVSLVAWHLVLWQVAAQKLGINTMPWWFKNTIA
jgi:O-antigen/teichoic acid export membrane protein